MRAKKGKEFFVRSLFRLPTLVDLSKALNRLGSLLDAKHRCTSFVEQPRVLPLLWRRYGVDDEGNVVWNHIRYSTAPKRHDVLRFAV